MFVFFFLQSIIIAKLTFSFSFHSEPGLTGNKVNMFNDYWNLVDVIGGSSVPSSLSLSSKTILSKEKLKFGRIKVIAKEEYSFKSGIGISWKKRQSLNPFINRLPCSFPDVDDHETILTLARLASYSYIPKGSNDPDFNRGIGFGWNDDGLRGYIFTNMDKSVVLISFKGTSTILQGGDTIVKDKHQDNVMFSCCCARVDRTWKTVCDCFVGKTGFFNGSQECNAQCLKDSVRADKNSYYYQAFSIVQLAIAQFPTAQVWFTGHSLGGAIAGLMGVSIRNTAAITFSSPGPLRYARNLGLHEDSLASDSWKYPVWNFGHSSDPIYTGTCNGLVTSCYLSGYAMETECRHGLDCEYKIKSWLPDLSTHRADWFIDEVLANPEKYPLPICVYNSGCEDCKAWNYTTTVL